MELIEANISPRLGEFLRSGGQICGKRGNGVPFLGAPEPEFGSAVELLNH